MSQTVLPLKRDEVSIHFLNADEDTYLTGTVLLREGDMVLDIPGGYGPYLIVGKLVGHRFEGTNSACGEGNRVNAKWADVGGIFVGMWVEEGDEYLFSFKFP